jgi:LppP/LprE lipoprotein
MRRQTGAASCVLMLSAAAVACTSHSPRNDAETASPSATLASASPSSTPPPHHTLSAGLRHLQQDIESRGFNVNADELRAAAEFAPLLRPVEVQHSFGDRCHNVLFFASGRYVGIDSRQCSIGPEVAWGDGREIAIVYPRYAKTDPLCCPTLDPDLVRFRLRGHRMQRID